MNGAEEITRRLDRIIQLLVFWMTEEKPQIERIRLLSNVGFGPAEIARILGTTANTVNVALHNIRKTQSVKRRGSTTPEQE
ncbi:MAG TPA: hypothetical protein VER58_17695 [Thermoanaerobaculia bacterium]|nr:hypothetical protein [Thermoanaerobaculia bacterium]